MVISGVLAIPMAFLRVPLSTFGMMLVGWIAATGILVIALAYLLIGSGLLLLKPAARVAAIALFALLAVNGLFDAFIPGTHAKMLEAMKGTPLFAREASHPIPPSRPLPVRLLPFGVLALPLWFLITRKQAFEQQDGPA